MAGFVPTDVFFNKLSGNLGRNTATKPTYDHVAHVHYVDPKETYDTKLAEAQLYLSKELYDDIVKSNTVSACPILDDATNCPGTSTCVVSPRPVEYNPESNKCVIFCLEENQEKYYVSYYLSENNENTFGGTDEPATCAEYVVFERESGISLFSCFCMSDEYLTRASRSIPQIHRLRIKVGKIS
jgi:hypothetical protein